MAEMAASLGGDFGGSLCAKFYRLFVLGGEQHLLHLRVCVTCFVSFAGVQGRDGVEAMEPGHGHSGTGRGSCCVGNLEFTE